MSLNDLSGREYQVREALRSGRGQKLYTQNSTLDFSSLKSAFAVGLHMQQPLIPAGGSELAKARLISNLEHMLANPHEGDNHNAAVFRDCYKRMATFIPQLLQEGKQPRVMLEYSGVLLEGLQRLGAWDVIDALRLLATESRFQSCVEWLGCTWGHAVAPSTPVQDFRLQVMTWQHHFFSLFGARALSRVRGFSPAEMALPNHPDVAYEFVKTLKDCGYEWVLLQEHTVEEKDGRPVENPHLPQLLVCTNSSGQTASITALIKTQGSDSKLVAQMQPYYQAREMERQKLADKEVPALVTQIADGENGGVMMNEFPGKYFEVVRECLSGPTAFLNGTEYLEHLWDSGVKESDLTEIQPLYTRLIWNRMEPGEGGERLGQVIEDLKQENSAFHMEGGSWTNDISWVRGYENLLGPMERVSSLFHERVAGQGVAPHEHRYQNALLHLLTSQTSCFRYWGDGLWTAYGREICRRAHDILHYDF